MELGWIWHYTRRGSCAGRVLLKKTRMQKHPLVNGLLLLLSLACASGSSAVIVDYGDGTGNTSPPSPDPGFDNVGNCYTESCVYLGNGWVLTANHVGPGDATFGGVVYPWYPGSAFQLHNPDSSIADLILFEIRSPFPPLPMLSIASAPPAVGAPLIMIGLGRDRGPAISWNGIDGYEWADTASMRWGTNAVENIPNLSTIESAFGTQLFGTQFDETGPGHSTYEAQAALGDSGGAVFTPNGAGFDLAGILIGIWRLPGQPSTDALYGDLTYSADLSVYQGEIATDMPEPRGGFVAGVFVVAALGKRHGSRRQTD